METFPKSWCWIKLDEIVAINPGIDKSEFRDNDELPFVPMSATEAGTGRIDTTELRPFAKVKTGFTAFATGDVLFAKITPCMENGKMAIVPALPKGVGFGTTEFHVLRPTDAVDTKLLYYFVSSESLRHEAQHKMTGAVGQKRVPKRYLETKEFPLPPLPEQRRIAKKIDKLFTRLNGGEANLRKAQKFLAHYRQSVLNHVIRGKFSENTDKWKQTKIGDFGKWGSGGTPARANQNYYGGSIPWLVIGDLNDSIVTESKTHITEAGLQNSSAKIIEPGTVLIAIYGSIGKTGIAGIRCATNQAIAHCVPARKIVTKKYLLLLLQSLHDELFAKSQGTTQKNISQKILKNHSVPLPPLPEQQRIVEKIDMLFTHANKLEEAIGAAQKSLSQCRQSILKAAFAGRLVPQNPADEPASALLARIKETCASISQNKKRKVKT